MSNASRKLFNAVVITFPPIFLLTNALETTEVIMTSKRLIRVNFEVFGVVQGVFFRKHTQEEAKKLNLKGWCKNTRQGTVQGIIEGNEDSVKKMKHWLQYTGSPHSRIEKAVFGSEEEISDLSFSDFTVKH